MRYREFLIEYNRDITKRQFGDKIADRLQNSPDNDLFNAYYKSLGEKGYPIEKILDTIATNILSSFENNDPTPNNQYTPWIAREYVKGTIRRLEDLSRIKNALELYHKYKNTRQFKELFKYNVGFNDISKLSADQVEGIAEKIEEKIIPQIGDKDKDKGDSEVVYEDSDVRVIHPKDKAAACYYGQGTRWCTAATKGINYFDSYNRSGPLYIIIPKKPKYQGEKYQLHIQEQQFMDEKDDPVSLTKLKNYPGFLKYIKEEFGDDDLLLFVDPKEITEINKKISEYVRDIVWEAVSDMEAEDDTWYQYRAEAALEKGYVDKDGEIDWDRVYEDPELNDYLQYNDDARRMLRNINDLEKKTGEQMLGDMADENQLEGGWIPVVGLEKYYLKWLDTWIGGNYWKRFNTDFQMTKNPKSNNLQGLKFKWIGKLGDYYVGFRQY